jgi:C4-type Zn-finger protein
MALMGALHYPLEAVWNLPHCATWSIESMMCLNCGARYNEIVAPYIENMIRNIDGHEIRDLRI